jgi:hypothetical protein
VTITTATTTATSEDSKPLLTYSQFNHKSSMLRNSHDDESKESLFFAKFNSPFQSSLTSAALSFIQGPEEAEQRSPMTGSCSPDRQMVQTPPGLPDESKESTHLYGKRSKVTS